MLLVKLFNPRVASYVAYHAEIYKLCPDGTGVRVEVGIGVRVEIGVGLAVTGETVAEGVGDKIALGGTPACDNGLEQPLIIKTNKKNAIPYLCIKITDPYQ